jgi:hypothetical protein
MLFLNLCLREKDCRTRRLQTAHIISVGLQELLVKRYSIVQPCISVQTVQSATFCNPFHMLQSSLSHVAITYVEDHKPRTRISLRSAAVAGKTA